LKTGVQTAIGTVIFTLAIMKYSRRVIGWWGSAAVDAVFYTLNSRPRKTLGWEIPAETLDEILT
jgi:hypothetical protein